MVHRKINRASGWLLVLSCNLSFSRVLSLTARYLRTVVDPTP